MAPRRKIPPLLEKMRPCSVLLDSADVVRYFCGEAGKYRYYPDVEIPQETVELTVSPELLLELQINHNLQVISNQQFTSYIEPPSVKDNTTVVEENNIDQHNVDQQINIPDVIKCTLKKSESSEIIKCIVKDFNKKRKKRGRPFSKKFICSKCKNRFSNFDFIKRHIRTVHNKIVHCKSCFIFFNCKLDLDQHNCEVNIIKKKKKCVYECEFCSEQIKQKKVLKLHVQKHLHFMRPLNDSELKNVKFFSRLKKSELKRYKVHCTSCCIDYNYEYFFKIHYSECCQNSNFNCPFCSISKYNFNSMTEHFQRHLVFLSKPFPCRLCKSVFLNDINLTTHLETLHQSDQPQEWETKLRYTSEVKTQDVKVPVVLSIEEKKFEVKISDTTVVTKEEDVTKQCSVENTDISEKMDTGDIKDSSLISCKNENLAMKKEDTKDTDEIVMQETQEMDTEEEKNLELSKIIEPVKESVETPKEEQVTEPVILNSTTQESEPDSDNSEKENQGLKLSSNVQEKSITIAKPSRIFIKTCKNIQETNQKLTLKYHYNVMCMQCEENFTLESYLNHLQNCLPLDNFKCSFCSNTLVKTGIDKRWSHIKTHLLRKSTESICDMCDLIFIDEYNMAVHAQNVHFM